MSKTARLENWSWVSPATDPYAAPESLSPRLYGEVYDHPTRKDGDKIFASELIGYDPDKDEFICASRNYKLGKVAEDYEAKFPDAKARLVKAVMEQTRMN